MIQLQAKPFVKWAGGKRQLLSSFEELYPRKLQDGKVKRYIEPFVGGGAVFFELANKYEFEEVILNDVNTVLISTYYVIKNNVYELIGNLKKIKDEFSVLTLEEQAVYFYKIREEFNSLKNDLKFFERPESDGEFVIKVCSYFLFLNKTCFNGLYRENKKGGFNVPFGKYKNPNIVDEVNLLNVNRLLKNVKLVSGDFEELTNYIDKETFIYLDPPYRPLNITSSFSSYSKGDFNDADQKRLSEWFRKASHSGAALMLSNSNPKNINPEDDFFEILYKGFTIYDNVLASRAINSNGGKRGVITELVIVSEGEN